MNRQTFIFLIFSISFAGQLVAQAPGPKYHIDTAGTLFWNKELPVYLHISPSAEEKGVTLKSTGQTQYTNPYYFDNEGVNEIRTQYATDPETGERAYPPVVVGFQVYADGTPPKSASRYTNARHFASSQMDYYSEGLQVNLSTEDKISGVETFQYAINGSTEKPYTGPLRFEEEGKYELQYYATDYTGNAEPSHSETFTVDLTPPVSQHKLDGVAFEDVIGDSSVLYLDVQDALSGVDKIYYRINDEPERLYNGKAISVAGYGNGGYTLYYYAVDHVGNREETRTFSFYLDKLPPILAADVLGDRFIVDDQIYFSGRSKLKLTAVDNKSGVRNLKYSVDYEDFKKYEKPFYLPSQPGVHVVRFYAVDNMANATEDRTQIDQKYYQFKHNVRKIYVDLTGPTLSHEFRGKQYTRDDTLFIGPRTKIQLTAQDGESGMQKTTYSIDHEQAENEYDKAFSIEKNGYHFAEYFGYDKVNNRNIGTFSFYVDALAPELSWQFSVEPIGRAEDEAKYPSYLALYAGATDGISGTEEISYAINGGTFRRYKDKITGFRPRQVNTVVLKSKDIFGNTSTQTLRFYVADKKGD